MRVFISWSGDRSRRAAHALSSWLPQVIQAVVPWVSTDIHKGARWSSELAEILEKTQVGILCLTRENRTEPWILFEAGALSNKKDAYVSTLLIGLSKADVPAPLTQFQNTDPTKDDMFRLIASINQKIGQSGQLQLDDKRLELSFSKFWPDIEQVLLEIVNESVSLTLDGSHEQEVIDKIIELIRNSKKLLIESEKKSEPDKFEKIYPEKTSFSHEDYKELLNMLGKTLE